MVLIEWLNSNNVLLVKSGALGFSVFRFWPFSRSVFRFLQWKTSVFRFCCPLWFPVFPFFSIWFSVFWQKQRGFSDLGDRCGFRFFQFGTTSKTRQTCTGSQCGFCGYVALSTAFKLQFCSYKHVISDMIGGPKNCFQQGLIFYFRLQFAINFFEDLVPLGDTGKAILIVSL